MKLWKSNDNKRQHNFQPLAFCLALFCTILASAGCLLAFYPSIVNTPQVFTDIIIENIAKSGLNKSGELSLFWALLLGGSILLCLLYPLFLHLLSLRTNAKKDKHGRHMDFLPGCFIVCIPIIIRLAAYGEITFPFLFIFIILFSFYFFGREVLSEGLLCFILLYYNVVSIFTIVSHFSTKGNITTTILYVLTFILYTILISCIILLKKNKKATLQMSILWMQFLLPGLLFVYFINTYLYRGEFIKVPYAIGYTAFFIILLICLALFNMWHLKKHRKNAGSLTWNHMVSAASAIAVFIYNSYSAAPMYAQPDQHHHGEQMIPWQQVFTSGQSLYEEYTPVSGLFPFFSGSIQHLLLNGTVSDYSPAISISMVLFCIITIYLIYKHIGGSWSLLFGIVFSLPCYNRQYMVLPILLLLTLPALFKKPNLWLPVWIWSNFLGGLYYPLFGAATLLGTLPLGMLQLYRLIKSGQLKRERQTFRFWIKWILCLSPIVLSLPLLLKMLMHTLTFSSQTILADGIALWGSFAPENFINYINSDILRSSLYLGIRFLLPAIMVWISLLLCYCVLISAKRTSIANLSPLPFALLASVITLCISFTYTLVRADTDMVLSRTSYIVVSIACFLAVLLIEYKDNSNIPKSLAGLLIGFCFGLSLLLYYQVSDIKRPEMWVYPNGESKLVMDDGSKLFTYHTVPDNFLKFDDPAFSDTLNDTSMLGAGFMVDDQLTYLKSYDTVIQKCRTNGFEDKTYMGLDGQGFYYYLNIKACGTGFLPAAKGYEAQQKILKEVTSKRPIVFLIEPESNYYVYSWLLTSDYVYCADDNAFYPAEVYQAIYGDTPSDDYRLTSNGIDFGLVASSFGQSINSLKDIFKKQTVNVDYYSDQQFHPVDSMQSTASIAGNEYDFLYLESEQLGYQADKLRIFWTTADESESSGYFADCSIKGNALLVPLGMNPAWFLSEITSIQFVFYKDEKEITINLDDWVEQIYLLSLKKNRNPL